jgi:cyclohexyl-isocyanide hydratase
MEYAPEPPFNCGTPQSAPPDVLEAALAATRKITEARLATAQRIAARFGIEPV